MSESTPKKLRVWLIDDMEHWHDVTKKTLDLLNDAVFQGFYAGSSALLALQYCSHDQLPDVIFMDYFINDERGDLVTRQIRESFPDLNCMIIGYSTAAAGSRAIVHAGADDIVAKHDDKSGMNPSLRIWVEGLNTSRARKA